MKLSLKVITLAAVAAATSAMKIGECDFTADCDKTSECAAGLLCADEYKIQLAEKGFDSRKADCGPTTNPKQKYYEVCFDPAILKSSGGGGGDPHFRTYDGTLYSFHGQCDVVMARSSEFAGGMGLDLHARTKIVGGGYWSLISNAALRIGNDTFELVNDGTVYINGKTNVQLPYKMMNQYTISTSTEVAAGSVRTFYIIELADSQKIKINLFKSMISVKVDATLHGTEGMLGVHHMKGMVGRDHSNVITNANAMGAEWQVTNTEPMLFQDMNHAPQYPAECMLPKVSSRRLQHSSEELVMAKEACADISEDMFDFCVEDVLVTGDSAIAHGYGEAF